MIKNNEKNKNKKDHTYKTQTLWNIKMNKSTGRPRTGQSKDFSQYTLVTGPWSII